MKRLAFACLAVLLVALAPDGTARAADLPTLPLKAQPLAAAYPLQGCGVYYGFNTMGGGGSVQGTAAGQNPASITETQAAIGVQAGYACASADGNRFYAFEALFDYTNVNGTGPGFSLSGPAAFEQRIKIGAPLSVIQAILPGLNITNLPPFPGAPAGVANPRMYPYFMVGLHEDDVSLNFGASSNRVWQISPSVGLGMITQLNGGSVMDVWAEMIPQVQSICIGGGAMCADKGTKYMAGAAIHF